MIVRNSRNFKFKLETILLKGNSEKTIEELSIPEAKNLVERLNKCIMSAESNELVTTFLRQNGMDEAQVETAITQLNKLRETI